MPLLTVSSYLCRSEAPQGASPFSVEQPAQTQPSKFTELNQVACMNPLRISFRVVSAASSRCQCAPIIKGDPSASEKQQES